MGPDKENNDSLESPTRVYSIMLLAAKTEIPVKLSAKTGARRRLGEECGVRGNK